MGSYENGAFHEGSPDKEVGDDAKGREQIKQCQPGQHGFLPPEKLNGQGYTGKEHHNTYLQPFGRQ